VNAVNAKSMIPLSVNGVASKPLSLYAGLTLDINS